MPDLADDGPDMLIHPSTKAFIARSGRKVLPLPEQCTCGRETGSDKKEGWSVRTLWTAENEQQRLLAELFCEQGWAQTL